jgi:A/G-specific adenine glycosylase
MRQQKEVIMLHEAEEKFVDTVWSYYAKNARDLTWRYPEADGSFDSYKILVSELMLQQTQVSRVVEKYHQFIKQFPDIRSLADAPLAEVLRNWQGLGYNRRAKYLHDTVRQVVYEYQGVLPTIKEELVRLPGIGPNTAGAILVYAYNQSEVFIETNIRSVFIHHFFRDKIEVTDKEILQLVTKTLPKSQSRMWYWALMDYGTYLKKTYGNPSKTSKQYSVQSRFEGSLRQLRGEVLRQLAAKQLSQQQLHRVIPDQRLLPVLDRLLHEKLIYHSGNYYGLGQG